MKAPIINDGVCICVGVCGCSQEFLYLSIYLSTQSHTHTHTHKQQSIYKYVEINLFVKHLQVSVAPGGRWSRFKTYSTIQRTLEIWGFVLTFVFKAWLNNKKFSYRG